MPVTYQSLLSVSFLPSSSCAVMSTTPSQIIVHVALSLSLSLSLSLPLSLFPFLGQTYVSCDWDIEKKEEYYNIKKAEVSLTDALYLCTTPLFPPCTRSTLTTSLVMRFYKGKRILPSTTAWICLSKRRSLVKKMPGPVLPAKTWFRPSRSLTCGSYPRSW